MISATLLLMMAQPAGLPECNEEAAEQGIQTEMNICARRDFLIADDELNAQWKITKAKMESMDAEMATYLLESDGRPGYFESLLEAQRAWLKYRDAHCRVDGYYARGGTLEPLLVSMCKTELTKQRTAQLKELAERGT